MMFVTKHARRLAVFPAILLFDIILGSRAVGQMPGGSEAKTITLGIVAETNQKEIEAHFQDFVRYLARKLSSSVEDRRKDCSRSDAVPARQPSYGEEGRFLHGEPPSDVYDQQRIRSGEIAPQALERRHGRLPRRDFHHEKR